MLGIRQYFNVNANIVVTNSNVLVTTGLLLPVGANQNIKCKWWLPFSVGATGGIRAQVVVPAGGTLYQVAIKLFNTVAPSITTAFQTASAAFTNALANAGNHWLEVEAIIINGATAGNIDLQVAQNTADALSLTILRGGSLETITF